MKQYFIGIFTTVCLTASVFMFMGSQNLNEKIDIDFINMQKNRKKREITTVDRYKYVLNNFSNYFGKEKQWISEIRDFDMLVRSECDIVDAKFKNRRNFPIVFSTKKIFFWIVKM